MSLFQVALETSCNELGIVDDTVFVCPLCLIEFIWWQSVTLNAFQPFFQVSDLQRSISSLVKLREWFSQVLDLVLGDSWGPECQSGPFEVHWFHIILHIAKNISTYFDFIVLFLPLSLDPRVIESFFRSESLIWLAVQQVWDQTLASADILSHCGAGKS